MIGVIGFADESHIRLLEKIGLPTLTTIANQIALAIRNSTLYARTTKLAHDLGQINHMTQTVSLAPEKDEALKEACHTAMKIANSDKVAVFLFDTDRKQFHLAYHTGLPTPLLKFYENPEPLSQLMEVDEPVLVHNLRYLPPNCARCR